MKSNKIELRFTQEMGHGFFAKQDIKAGEQILQAKTQFFITCTQYAQFYEFSDLKQKIQKKVLFAYFLAAVEVTSQNEIDMKQIKEYFKVLPKKLSGMVCWTMEELNAIHNLELVQIVKAKIKGIKQEYEKIQQKIKESWQSPKQTWEYRLFTDIQQIKLITFQRVIYFYSVIQSRSVHYSCDQDSNSDVGALAPQLQLFNHSINPQCQVQVGAYRYSVKTRQPIKKDEQIFVSYGKFDEQEFLEMYGFLQTLEKPISYDENYRFNIAKEYNLLYNKHQRK